MLNSTRTAIGSQCNFISSRVAWLYFIAPSIKQAAQYDLYEIVVFASEAVDTAVYKGVQVGHDTWRDSARL